MPNDDTMCDDDKEYLDLLFEAESIERDADAWLMQAEEESRFWSAAVQEESMKQSWQAQGGIGVYMLHPEMLSLGQDPFWGSALLVF